MKALTFHFAMGRMAAARTLGAMSPGWFLSAIGPVQLEDVPDARVLGPRWVVVETALCGICGSDVKQVFLDGAMDNPLTALISFPHVLGHEHVGTVVAVGAEVTQVRAGDRVACSPWLSCAPRGLPECEACLRGQVSVCENFVQGSLSPGMHAGTCRDVSGGFASYVPAHETMCHRLPDAVSFAQAVLADPFSVGLHAVLKSPPQPGESVLVIGCGGVGALLTHLIASLFPSVRVFCVDPRAHARALAESLGASRTFAHGGAALIEEIAAAIDAPVRQPRFGLPWIHRGIDRIYDTVGSAATLEAGLRVVRPHGAIVLVGVSTPRRFEWTPLYFKEVSIVGSSGYGVETVDGKARHAIDGYFDMLASGRVRPEGVLTNRFALSDYKPALLTARSKNGSSAIKVAFDFQTSRSGGGS